MAAHYTEPGVAGFPPVRSGHERPHIGGGLPHWLTTRRGARQRLAAEVREQAYSFKRRRCAIICAAYVVGVPPRGRHAWFRFGASMRPFPRLLRISLVVGLLVTLGGTALARPDAVINDATVELGAVEIQGSTTLANAF